MLLFVKLRSLALQTLFVLLVCVILFVELPYLG